MVKQLPISQHGRQMRPETSATRGIQNGVEIGSAWELEDSLAKWRGNMGPFSSPNWSTEPRVGVRQAQRWLLQTHLVTPKIDLICAQHGHGALRIYSVSPKLCPWGWACPYHFTGVRFYLGNLPIIWFCWVFPVEQREYSEWKHPDRIRTKMDGIIPTCGRKFSVHDPNFLAQGTVYVKFATRQIGDLLERWRERLCGRKFEWKGLAQSCLWIGASQTCEQYTIPTTRITLASV